MLAALLGDPPGLFKVAMAESLLAFPSVVARVMDSREFFVNCFV